MSPITHFLIGWSVLEKHLPSNRDKALVGLAGIAPDLDGIGIVVDFVTRQLSLPETNYYQTFHRMYGHGLPAAISIALIAGVFGNSKVRAALFAFLNAHFHFICDLLGSRGTSPDDLWGIYYLAPISDAHEVVWHGQWPLVGWQNMSITALLLLVVASSACRRGYTPISLISKTADQEIVATLRRWKKALGRS